jgi:hypothetical protein
MSKVIDLLADLDTLQDKLIEASSTLQGEQRTNALLTIVVSLILLQAQIVEAMDERLTKIEEGR